MFVVGQLGWYRPSVGVPETFGGYGVVVVYFLRLTIFSSVIRARHAQARNGRIGPDV